MTSRLNLVSAGADRELDAIRDTIGVFVDVAGFDDVVAALQTCAQRGERVEMVDAIGHSRSPGFLVLGSWVLDDSPQTAAGFSVLLRPLLRQLGVHTVRLLGCSTAGSPRCRSVIRAIAHAGRCVAAGTTRLVGRNHYALGGFVADWALDVAGAESR
jgi:hypothetical protein